MSISDHRHEFEEQLIVLLSAVEGAGTINRGRRDWRDTEAWTAAFTYRQDGRRFLRGWEVYRTNSQPLRGGAESGVPLTMTRWVHTYTVRGYYGYEEMGDSYEGFQNWADSLLETLNTEITLNDTVDLRTTDIAATLDVDEVGDTLVHVCDIQLTVEEEIATTFV